jgi:hypothetical protein
MLPIIAGIVSSLISGGLPKVAQSVIEKGTEYVEDKLGIKLKPEMSQEELQRVSEAAMKHEEFLIQEENKNTADARDMQKVALKQDDVWSKRFIYIFAGVWSIFVMVYISWITFGTIPIASVRFADTILGFLLGTIVSTIINFFFGSSSGSSKKTEQLIEGLKDAARKPNG